MRCDPSKLFEDYELVNGHGYSPALSNDELLMVYASSGSPAVGRGIFQVTRPSVADPFGQPQLLAGIGEGHVGLSGDGLTIYFHRPNGTSHRATRVSRNAPFGVAEQLVETPTTPTSHDVLILHGSPGGTLALVDPALPKKLGSFAMAASGLTVYFSRSTDGGGVFRAARSSTTAPFGAPVPDAVLSTRYASSAYTGAPQWVSLDDCVLYATFLTPAGSMVVVRAARGP